MSGEAHNSLITLTGLEFRQVPVSCPYCYWDGAAGDLIVPGSSALADGVTYHCPVCERAVAHHHGLSDAEVQAELINIRRELRKELRFTRAAEEVTPVPTDDATHPESDAAMTVPSFDEVRARIRGIC